MSSSLVETLLQSAADPTWIVDGNHRVLHFNRSFARLYADSHGGEATVGMAAGDLFVDCWSELFARTMAGRGLSADASLLVAGILRRYFLAGMPVIAEDGAVTSAVFTAREITDLPRAGRDDLFELSLTRLFIDDHRQLAETLAAAIEYLCESDHWDCGVIWLVGENSSTLDAVATHYVPSLRHGEELRQELGSLHFPRGRGLPGRTWAADDIVWIANLADDSAIVRARLAEKLGLRAAVGVPLRDGSRFVGVLELFARQVLPVDDAHARALLRTGAGLGRLIERRRAEDERRHLLQVIERKGLEWSLTFDAIELPIFITSMDGVVRRVNRAARELTRRDYPDLIGKRIRRLDDGEPWITLSACVEAVRDSGQTCTAQAHHDETDRSWDIAANWFHPADETPRAILVARETTGIIRLQSAVRRGEQLSALGELVAGVAHEVRNPIFGMQISLETLESMLPKDGDVGEMMSALRKWLQRLERLMESLLAYGRTWSIDLRKGSLTEIVQQALDGTRPVADAAGVSVRTEIAVESSMLMDSSRLGQALENLITNAIQHSNRNDEVTVTAAEEEGFVSCAVRDRGPGFSPADLPRIFEPFFTRRRGGTGLGLAIAQRVVDEHGGTLHAGNAPDGGAIVTARFPVYQG